MIRREGVIGAGCKTENDRQHKFHDKPYDGPFDEPIKSSVSLFASFLNNILKRSKHGANNLSHLYLLLNSSNHTQTTEKTKEVLPS